MNLSVVFRRPARQEFGEAIDWYENQCEGLGVRFSAAVERVLVQAAANPLRYAKVHGEIPEGLVPHFPYVVYYIDEPDRIVVLAVFHASRNPAIWQGRS